MVTALLTRCHYCGAIVGIESHGVIERMLYHNIPRTKVECHFSLTVANTHNNRTNGFYQRETDHVR